ncbi:MAG: hypothetical protein MUF34_18470 [Polyangiaceae bacterium]|nr:hypothetical protein [Polyangiaceae bacterium]
MVDAVGGAVPLVGDADAPGEADLAVEHQELTVGAVVHGGQVEQPGLVILLDLDPGRLHRAEQIVVELRAAHPVEQDVHLDPRPRLRGQRLAEASPDLARPVNVGLEVDGALGRVDRRQHRGEDLLAVAQLFDAVVAQHRRAEQVAHRARELRVFDAVTRHDVRVDLLLARRQIGREQPDE